MNRWILNALGLFAVAALGATTWALIQWGEAGATVPASLEHINATTATLQQSAAALTGTLNQATDTLRQTQTTIAAAQPVLLGFQATADTLNRECGDGHPCGTLADVAKTLGTVRGTFGQIEVAANHEDRNLTTLDSQERTLFADLHETVSAAPPLMGEYRGVASNLNGWLKSRTLQQTADNVQSITASGAGIMANGKTASDYLTKQLITPKTFLQRVEGYSGDTFDVVAYLARHYR